MARTSWALLLALWLILGGIAAAADPVPSGNYKVTLQLRGRLATLWLLKLTNKDGKLTGEVIAKQAQAPPAKLTEIGVKDQALRLALDLGELKIQVEGKVPAADGKKIHGVFFLPGQDLAPAFLELTDLESLDSFELNREVLLQANPGPEVFDAALFVLSKAGDKKAKVEDVRNWANKAFKAAEPYGPLWQREMALRMAEVLGSSEEYAPVAVQYARQVERLLQPSDKLGVRRRTLTVLAAALAKSGKPEEAKEITAQLDKLQPVTTTKFAGRKGTSDRVVVVELFTGAESPFCVAADLAFDALGRTFTPKDVLLLQYHLHAGGADPLANADTDARRSYYGDEIEKAPTIFFNGKVQDFQGGSIDDAQERYGEYVPALTPLLEKAPRVKLKAAAALKDGKFEITAETRELDEPSDKMRLRLALVEETVQYRGSNKLANHPWVVRAFPGGVAGLPLKEKTGKQTVTVDLDEVRKRLTRYLDEAAKDLEFPSKERPLELKKLRVVAFVQNDSTREILQAAYVDLPVPK